MGNFENQLRNLMNTKLATIALSAFLLLAQTVSAQIDTSVRYVQIRSIDLTSSVLELHNFGPNGQSLAGWRFCTHNTTLVRRYTGVSPVLANFTLASGQSLYVHFGNDDDNDPTNNQRVNVSALGGSAAPMAGQSAYGAQIYWRTSFGIGANIADHLQFSVDGVDNTTADDRSDEAEGEVWADQNEWISIASDTEMIVLNDDASENEINSPSDYTVVNPITFIVGDVNDDGEVNFMDIAPFISVLSNANFTPAADINGDGSLDFGDIGPFIQLLAM